MQSQTTTRQCLICCEEIQKDYVQLEKCKHSYCLKCLKEFIDTLKRHNLLKPQKLICVVNKCQEELSDALLNKLYPGQLGFVLSVVRKRYKQSKDPAIKIFNCKGFTKLNRQPLVDKPSSMSRQAHTRLMNEKLRNMFAQKQIVEDKKICTNILSFNKLNTKQKIIQCYICGVSYCPQCEDFSHEDKCQSKESQNQLNKFTKNKEQTQNNNGQDIQAFIEANSMAKCLNPRCGLHIQKEEGCFWVKCRCSWQFCYPCRKLWGDCEHFSKYPYKKFTPPPQWMVKALNLY